MILNTPDDISKAVQHSGIKNFEGNYKHLGGGERNNTYILDCEDKSVILRIAKHVDQKSLHKEARALALIDVPQIPKLIYFDAESRINNREWIVESYIPGILVDRLNSDQFRNLGVLLANVHKIKSDKVGIDLWPCFLVGCKSFGNEYALLNHPDPELKSLIISAKEYFKVWQPQLNNVAESLIHGDATPSNILINDSTVSLIDWEFASYKDPLAEFSTVFYEDMEFNQGKWRVHINIEEKEALYEGYASAGGVINEERIKFWINFDKLGAAVFLYWRINQTDREASTEQLAQYQFDLDNIIKSLHINMTY